MRNEREMRVRVLLGLLIITSVFANELLDYEVLSDDGYVPGREKEFVGHKGRVRVDEYCQSNLFQERFCGMDFVIMARKAGPITHFYGDPESYRKPHAGLIVPMLVQQRFRGPYENGSLIFVHFITGRDDNGLHRTFIPWYDHPFILTGFVENTMDTKGVRQQVPVVNFCSDSFPLAAITDTLISAIFFDAYCPEKGCPERITFREDLRHSPNTCFYREYYKHCYNKYAVCFKHEGVAKWISFKVPTNGLWKVPVELHERILNTTYGETNADRFYKCLRDED